MARIMKNGEFKRGQVLILVFMVMLLAAILAGGAALMWQSGIQSYAENRDSLVAFYAAMAGIEQGFIEAINIGGGKFNKTTPGNIGDANFTLNISGKQHSSGDATKTDVTVISTGNYKNSSRVIRRTALIIDVQDAKGKHLGWFIQRDRKTGWSEQ